MGSESFDFDIKVAGDTNLKGGVIASEAEADKNRLSTQSLSFEDIHNHLDTDAKSQQASLNLPCRINE